MEKLITEKEMVLRQSILINYPTLYEVTKCYLSEDFERNEAIIRACLSCHVENIYTSPKIDLKEALLSRLKTECRKFNNEGQTFNQYCVSVAFVNSMKSKTPFPVTSWIPERNIKIINGILIGVYFNRKSLKEVSKIYNLSETVAFDYFEHAIQKYKNLLQGIALT
jgi:hypothetical protein